MCAGVGVGVYAHVHPPTWYFLQVHRLNKFISLTRKQIARGVSPLFDLAFHWRVEYEEAELEARVEGQELTKHGLVIRGGSH